MFVLQRGPAIKTADLSRMRPRLPPRDSCDMLRQHPCDPEERRQKKTEGWNFSHTCPTDTKLFFFFFFCQDRNRFDSSDGSTERFPARRLLLPSVSAARPLKAPEEDGEENRKPPPVHLPIKRVARAALYRNFTRTRWQFSIQNNSSSNSSSQLFFSGIFFFSPPSLLIPNGLFSRLCLQCRSSPPGRGAQQVQPRRRQEALGQR